MKIYNKGVNITDSNNDRMLWKTTNNRFLNGDFRVRKKERETRTERKRDCIKMVFRHENVEF